MKKFIFNYYKKFSCIGSKCLHNCCIGWEIKIDKRAKNKYEELQAKDKRFSIDNYKMGVFNLSKKMRCPYLEEDGLCYIIKNYGESYLCKTCKTHPRFITYFSGRTETGLGLSCEEACRVILNFKPKMKLVLVKDDKNAKRLSLFERELIAFRNRALKIAQDRKISIEERLDKLLTISKVDIRKRAYGEWVKIFNGLEKLKISDYKGEKLEKYSDFLNLSKDFERQYEQILSYLIYRHLSRAIDMLDLEVRLAFVVLAFKMINQMYCCEQEGINGLIEGCRIFSSEIEYNDDNIFSLLNELESLISFI